MNEVGNGEIDDRLHSVLTSGSLSRSPADITASRVENSLLDSTTEPSCVLRPADVDELHQLMRLANELRMNLTVASSTGRHCKGGFAASQDNMRVDLSSWKGIPWINRRNRVCLIEPGVTYGDLLPRLQAEGMTAPMPLAPRSGKSVLAAVMDREPSTWPNRQWDSGDPLASTEFIFGSGERFRTGAAGGPGTLEAQRAAGGAQKSSAGPSQTDFNRVVQPVRRLRQILQRKVVEHIRVVPELFPEHRDDTSIVLLLLRRQVPVDEFPHKLKRNDAVDTDRLGDEVYMLCRIANVDLVATAFDKFVQPRG